MTDAPRSAAAYDRARTVMPGGNTRASNYEAPFPIYLASGDGASVTDIDGRRYLDFQNNFTALIHGYNHPGVTEALARQTSRGLSFANPTVSEIDLAELLCARVPYFDQVRFTNTGSEAVMMAIKAARALTGRRLIAKCEGAYHGNYDFVEMSVATPPSPWGPAPRHGEPAHLGVARSARSDVVIIPFNDVDTTRRLLDQVKDELAAVIVDPMPSRAGLVPISDAYLSLLSSLTKASGSLLISDEVLSFRLGYAGALGNRAHFPDICAFGKIVGGGLPVGAIAGSAEVMKIFDPSGGKAGVAHAGTFTANPMTMVAGAAAMRDMTPDAFQRLNTLGERTRAALRATLTALDVPGTVTGAGSLFRIFLGRSEVTSYADAAAASAAKADLARLVDGMRRRGVMLSSIALGALSTPMSDADISALQETFHDALVAVRGEAVDA